MRAWQYLCHELVFSSLSVSAFPLSDSLKVCQRRPLSVFFMSSFTSCGIVLSKSFHVQEHLRLQDQVTNESQMHQKPPGEISIQPSILTHFTTKSLLLASLLVSKTVPLPLTQEVLAVSLALFMPVVLSLVSDRLSFSFSGC